MTVGPWRWLERLLTRILPEGLSGESTLGDLAEEFDRRAATSLTLAHAWYAGQALSLMAYAVVAGNGTHSGTPQAAVLDLRWTLRSMARHPGFTLGIAAVLGLGFGSNVAVFSVIDGTLQNSSEWSKPGRTYRVWPERNWSFGNLELFREDQTAYRTLGEYMEVAVALADAEGGSRSVNAVRMTPDLFGELDSQPILGRGLEDDDGFFGGERVVVIGAGLWTRAYGADPSIVGSTLMVNGAPTRVVGIQAPAGRAPGGRAELWLPLSMDPRDDDYFKAVDKVMIGVTRDGAGPLDAQADLDTFTARLSGMFPTFYPADWAEGARVERANAALRRQIEAPLWLLLAGTGLLVVLTALNVGNLLLGRSIDRRRELAIRRSLGAGRGRIVRQLLVEGGVLTALGLGVGLAVAGGGSRSLARLFVDEPIVAAAGVTSPRVLLFGIALAGVAGLVLNAVPVLHFLRTTAGAGAGGTPGGSGLRMQRGLVTGQAAVATALLVSATLFVATVDRLRSVPLGFEAGGITVVELSPPADRVASTEAARAWTERLVERARALPEVRDAGLVSRVPLRHAPRRVGINPEANPEDPREALRAEMHVVDPGFFDVFQVDVVEGRAIDPRDVALDSPSVVVINRAMADAYWPDGDAIGQRIAVDPHAWSRFVPIVGIVEDVRAGDLSGPMSPAFYVSLAEQPSPDISLIVRAEDTAARLAPALGAVVRSVDPLVAVRGVASMTDVVRAAYSTSWVLMGLLGLLAALATVLGALGMYAVLAHHVSSNSRAIGVRMALGAPREAVIAGIVRSGLRSVGLGVALGCIATLAAGRLLESVVVGAAPLAPSTFVMPVVALLGAATAAAWIPAARAGRLAPAEVLRSD